MRTNINISEKPELKRILWRKKDGKTAQKRKIKNKKKCFEEKKNWKIWNRKSGRVYHEHNALVCLLLWMRALRYVLFYYNPYLRISHMWYSFRWQNWHVAHVRHKALNRGGYYCVQQIQTKIRCCPWFYVVYRVLLFLLKCWSFRPFFFIYLFISFSLLFLFANVAHLTSLIVHPYTHTFALVLPLRMPINLRTDAPPHATEPINVVSNRLKMVTEIIDFAIIQNSVYFLLNSANSY